MTLPEAMPIARTRTMLAGRLDPQVGLRQRPRQPDRLVRLRRVARTPGAPPTSRPSASTRCGRKSAQVLDEEDVGEAAGRDRAELVAEAEVLGAVERRHLDRDERVDALLDRPPDDAVHVAVGDDRVREHVVGDEEAVARSRRRPR